MGWPVYVEENLQEIPTTSRPSPNKLPLEEEKSNGGCEEQARPLSFLLMFWEAE